MTTSDLVGATLPLTGEDTLLHMRLQRPRVSGNLLPRPHLLERLNHGLQRPLILVSAPAGFGKSTLIATWLQQLAQPTTWLSLEASDNEFNRFLSYFVAAVQTIFPTGCTGAALPTLSGDSSYCLHPHRARKFSWPGVA